ncbi:hypothetical protein F5B21DRAFT_492322 [Xylaria acuta]|nr:hypothetical protein F5B21DRAFT_492322 [Xylaria acuta]
MPITRCGISLRKRLEATGAIRQFQEGRPDRFPLQEVQAVVNDLLRIRGIEQGELQEIDQYLGDKIAQLKYDLHAQEVATVACCHAMSYDRVREQLISIRPPDELPQHIPRKLKAWVQCIFQCQKARSSLFRKAERAAMIQLLHVVVPAGSKSLQPIWKLLRAVGDGSVQELLPIAFVKKALVYCDYWMKLSDELEALQSSRRWSEAWALVKGMRRAANNPQIQELLRQGLKGYSMWASWNPNIDLINKWNSPVLSSHRHQLAIILDLEGPDTTGAQHGTLGGASISPNDSLQSRALEAASWAVNLGEGGVRCLADFCTSVDGLTEQGVGLLESILELGAPNTIAEAGILFRFSGEYTSRPSVNSRISILVPSLYAVQTSQKLQQLLGAELQDYSHETLRDAQINCYAELQEGDPNNRIAFGIIKLARALISANWLTHYWSAEYTQMLHQIPPEEDVSNILDRISRTEGRERQTHVEYLVEKLCAGPQASTAAHGESPDDGQPEDPIWTFPTDVDRERLRHILARVEWADKATRTACVQRAEDEEDNFVQSLNIIMSDNTDHVCVKLARFLGALAIKSGNLARCWKTLLLAMMRARPKGLLDRLGESLSFQSWQDWLNCLQRIFADGYLDPEGQLGFTKPKIREWQLRKMSLGRAGSGASTATRSTGGLSMSRRESLCEPGTPLTIPALPESEDQPGVRCDVNKSHNTLSDVAEKGTRDCKTSVGSSEVIPWYEREIDSLNTYKSCACPVKGASGTRRAAINEDEGIYN